MLKQLERFRPGQVTVAVAVSIIVGVVSGVAARYILIHNHPCGSHLIVTGDDALDAPCHTIYTSTWWLTILLGAAAAIATALSFAVTAYIRLKDRRRN